MCSGDLHWLRRRHGDAARRILESARACDTGDGVVVLTDMFGGTPSNLGISIMEEARLKVLAGVDLPVW